jgi:hypothetical protein
MDFNALLVDWRSCGSASALEASPGKSETPYEALMLRLAAP